MELIQIGFNMSINFNAIKKSFRRFELLGNRLDYVAKPNNYSFTKYRIDYEVNQRIVLKYPIRFIKHCWVEILARFAVLVLILTINP